MNKLEEKPPNPVLEEEHRSRSRTHSPFFKGG
ncbi:MAG: hypothetical protein HW421_386 [Ignavibacteria bacterium]|nr:hypothetical protein [Ignavibacteria bacterium]